jgi:hypothetical protein
MILVAMVGWSILTVQSPAQNTNPCPPVPSTTLETWESSTGRVIVKGTAPMGSVSASAAVVSVVCKEDAVVGTSQKVYGITVGIKVNGQPEDRTVIDYDELDSLLSAIDYLSKIDWSVTSLSSFDASYTTKAGLRLVAFSSKRAGQIEFAVRSSRMAKGILVAPDQLSQLRSLVDQAKNKLDAIRNG